MQRESTNNLETISLKDFSVKWKKDLYDAERKLAQLLLKESQLMYDKMGKELNDTIKSAYLENSVDIKNEIINRNLTLQITLNESRVKN